MAESTPQHKAQGEIPFGVLEYTATFNELLLEKFNPALVVPAVLNAIGRWGFGVDGIEIKTHSDKLSDYAIIFRRTTPTTPTLTVTLSVGKLVIFAENLGWSDAEQFISGMEATIGGILHSTGATLRAQQVVLALHVQLKDTPRQEITKALLSPLAHSLMDGKVNFSGIILYRENATVIIDASVVYANALFVRIIRQHAPGAKLEQLAEILRKDEEQLLRVLGIEATS